MTASLLSGKQAAAERLLIFKQQVEKRLDLGLRPPGLAVVLLGDDPASQIYLKHKYIACKAAGFNTYPHHLPAETSEKALIDLISALNQNSDVDGILVQLPLPQHINAEIILDMIHPSKDVDGFHPYNMGRLAEGNPSLRPCTPYGIMKLLAYYNINPEGKNAVVIGASNIVGRPMALELLLAKATVTVCHRATKNLGEHVKRAELVIIAAGSKDIIPLDCFHAQHIILDVGMHREPDGRLRGDIDFNQVKNKVAWITPVPGGIGPMTISCLLENTLKAAEENV
jgi:methylenetetrahydrofolate dehydrogenase (NADP+) / methenyltetrahydrofolate cyclohydrolase